MLDGLVPFQEDSTNKILISMMDDKGIDTKTEVEVPLAIAQLYTFAKMLESAGATTTAKPILDLIAKYLVLQVSKDRKGRTEIFSTLAAIIKDERSKADKLTSAPDSESL
ncbi:MAG: hypothetical protein MUP60_01110 [Candidatus Thorarchaeota archaeon]|nr:hypothetical protein [Candidatus Thorarchaeota archaeon]